MKYKNYLLMIVLENVGIIYIYWTKDLSMFYSNRYENWNIVKLYPWIRLYIYRFWLPHEPWIDVKFWEGKFFWIAYDNCVLCLRIFLFVYALNYCCNPCSVFCYILIIRIKTLVWYLLEAWHEFPRKQVFFEVEVNEVDHIIFSFVIILHERFRDLQGSF